MAHALSREQRGKAKLYLWYLELPFNDPNSSHYFDREHWWKKTPRDVSHNAALYELIRRHPKVGELQYQTLHPSQEVSPSTHHFASELVLNGPVPLKVRLENEPLCHVANQIILFGLRSWPKLSKEHQAKFHDSLRATYPGKGRDLTKGAFDLTEAARAWVASEKDVGGPSFEECIKELAATYASDGRLILAADTQFGSRKKAEATFKHISEVFWKHWQKSGRRVRAHESDWLKAIQDFECEFDLKGYGQFKLGYPKTFKRFIAHFEDDQARGLRTWWRRQGRSQWAAQHGSKGS